MTSYNLLNGVHTANRKDILTEILRAEWDFEGVVMTDWSTTSDRLNRGKHVASRAALCVKAGNDLTMPGTRADVEDILSAIHSGELERSELEECAGRILSLSSMLSV